jgi:RND family efflux transporter MFP subunit
MPAMHIEHPIESTRRAGTTGRAGPASRGLRVRLLATGLVAGVAVVATTASAQAPTERPLPVEIAQAEVRELAPSVHATGLVRSRAAADLAAAVGGRLQWVAEPGTAVSAGEVVARLDTRELSLARAEQAARVRRAEVNLQALDRELTRLRASGNAVPRFNVDQAQANRDIAEADLQVARALLAQTDDQLARSRLTAPFAGVVSDRVRRAGEEVGRGEVIARIVNPDELEIRMFVPLRHVRAVQPGHEVEVVGDNREFTARVSSIVPAGDPRTQSFEVLIKAPPVEGLLAAGNTVKVRLPLGEPQRRLSVPRDALVIRADGLYIVKLNGEQRAERVPVKAGVADGDWIAVDGTLKAGESVVVRGAENLRGNEKLDVVGVLEQEPKRLSLQATKPDA